MSWVAFGASATSGSCILVKLGLPTGVEAPSKPRPQELRSPPSPPRRFDDIPGQHPKCQARQKHLRMSGNNRKELRSKCSILQPYAKEESIIPIIYIDLRIYCLFIPGTGLAGASTRSH